MVEAVAEVEAVAVEPEVTAEVAEPVVEAVPEVVAVEPEVIVEVAEPVVEAAEKWK